MRSAAWRCLPVATVPDSSRLSTAATTRRLSLLSSGTLLSAICTRACSSISWELPASAIGVSLGLDEGTLGAASLVDAGGEGGDAGVWAPRLPSIPASTMARASSKYRDVAIRVLRLKGWEDTILQSLMG